MKRICLIIAMIMIFACFGSVSAAETLENPTICTWKDNKTSAVSIRIDDGLYESAVIYNQLQKKYGVKSTQMMITNKLDNDDGSIDTELVANWQAIFDEGYMDLGNHSYTHNIRYNNTDTYTTEEMVHDITGSYNLLRRCFPDQDVIFFTPPWGNTKGGSLEEAKKNHYALTKSSTSNPNKSTPKDMFLISAETSTNSKAVSDLTAWVDNAVTAKGWQVILFHGIETGSKPSTYETLDENVEALFQYMKQKSDAGDVWSGSLNEVAKYVYERDSATVTATQADDATIKISLTDTMADNNIFDYPLTVKVNVPTSWTGRISAVQAGNAENLTAYTENGKKYVYAHIVPDGGEAAVVLEGSSEVVGDTLYLTGPGKITDNSAWIAKKNEIKKVEISGGLAGIGKDVFSQFDSISSVSFDGTYDDWKSFAIDSGNDALKYSSISHLSGTLLAPAKDYRGKVEVNVNNSVVGAQRNLSLEVKLDKTAKDDLSIYLAIYNANGKLTTLRQPDLVEGESSDIFTANETLSKDDNYKLMVWAKNCTPATDYAD